MERIGSIIDERLNKLFKEQEFSSNKIIELKNSIQCKQEEVDNLKWTIDSLIQHFVETRAKFKTEIDQSIVQHQELTAHIANCEDDLSKKTKELAELENNFSNIVDQLKTKIDNKKERNQELSRLIRIEQELNIEKENNTKKETEQKIENTKNEFKETQSKLSKIHQTKKAEKQEEIDNKISMDLYRILIAVNEDHSNSINQGVKNMIFSLEKVLIHYLKQEEKYETLVESK